MKMRRICSIFSLLLLVALVGCDSQVADQASSIPVVADVEAEANVSGMRAAFAQDSAAAKAGSLLALASISAVQPDRFLIKNAVVLLETEDPEVIANDVTNAVSAAGGYVGDLNESTDGLGRRSVALTVRIPANRFDEVVVGLSSMGKVLQKQVTAQDVTEEYVDTEARSRNLKVSEERIIDHLGRAGTLEDILHVERELTRVRQQIEQLDGRVRYLSDRVAFSTLNITLRERPAVETLLPAQTFSIGQTFSQATRSLTALGQKLLIVGVWVAVWSPVWILTALVALYVRRRFQQRATP